MNLLLSLSLVLILCAPRCVSAQAATEYGLTAGSSATSVSNAGTILNRKLDQTTNGKISHTAGATAVHSTRLSGAKVRGASTKTGPSSTATATHHVTKQASADGSPAAARGVSPGGFTIVGAEAGSGGSSTVASSPQASPSGFTVVGSEPR